MNKEISVNIKQLISFIAVLCGTVIPTIYFFAQKNIRNEYNSEFVLKELKRIEHENLMRIEKNSSQIEQLKSAFAQQRVSQKNEINKIILFINDFLISERGKNSEKKEK